MEVSVQQLRVMTNQILDHLHEYHGDAIDLPLDYYWQIRVEELYDVEKMIEPSELGIGQLSENWDTLIKMTADDSIISYSLVWLSAIFRAIGETAVS